jgi:aquaporin Z
MATKKAASTKKPAVKKAVTTVKQATKVSTVKAVSAKNKSGFLSSPLKRAPIIVALIAEFIGTFILASTYIAGQGQPIILLFAVAGIVLLFGTLSGAHLNPALTIASLVTRRITALRALGYVVAQFLGAGISFAVLDAFVKGAAPLSAQAAAYGQTATTLFKATAIPADKEWYLFFAELIGSIILGFAFSTVVRLRRDRLTSSLTAGLGIFVALLFAASAAAYVGGSAVLNPAVALSLQALSWSFNPILVYVVASIIGATGGFVLSNVLANQSEVQE